MKHEPKTPKLTTCIVSCRAVLTNPQLHMPRVKSPRKREAPLDSNLPLSDKRILRVNACARAGLQRQYVTCPLSSLLPRL
jgi:hypothetical protein